MSFYCAFCSFVRYIASMNFNYDNLRPVFTRVRLGQFLLPLIVIAISLSSCGQRYCYRHPFNPWCPDHREHRVSVHISFFHSMFVGPRYYAVHQPAPPTGGNYVGSGPVTTVRGPQATGSVGATTAVEKPYKVKGNRVKTPRPERSERRSENAVGAHSGGSHGRAHGSGGHHHGGGHGHANHYPGADVR